MSNQATFNVPLSEAEAFAKVWNYMGVAVNLDAVSVKFAADFANVVLKNFINICKTQAQQEAAAQIAAQNKKPLIIEGH